MRPVIVRSVYRLPISGSMISTVLSMLGRAGFYHWNWTIFDPVNREIEQ